MAEKCDSHDDCFKRLYGKTESLEEHIDRRFDEMIKELHAGAIRFTQLEMRLAQCERQIAPADGVDWKGRFVGLGFNLLQNGILVIVAMAWWASRNGWGG